MYNYTPGNPNEQQYQAAYRQAERRVRAKLGFYWHLASYVLVNGLLIAIYLLTGPLISGGAVYPWFIWPMFGWGIGLLFHFLGTFVFSNVSSDENRRRMIEEEMRRMGAYPPGNIYSSGMPPAPPGGTTGSVDNNLPPK
ncbi:MAG: 2TM domain-containing protein [Chloroflexi bacterium]|nr:2TM domain-containing protein [Chloroflexota bacterium]OJV86787.1 MAG: hypothetical protein BGO39_13180 [Chloroflexi bacterium 54-19]